VEVRFGRYEKTLQPDLSDTMRVHRNLGMLSQAQGKLIEAEAMWKRAIAGYEKALELDYPQTLRVIQNLGCSTRAEASSMWWR
jgi:Tetratricopeptide repeat